MKAIIYGYQDGTTGRICSYKLNFVSSFSGGCALKTEIEIPEFLKPQRTESGDILITDRQYIAEDDDYYDYVYSLSLNNLFYVNHETDKPMLMIPTKDELCALKVYSEEWISRAMTL